MGRHSSAQTELVAAFTAVFGRAPTVNERLFAGAIALGESGYSTAYYTNKLTGERKILNNWGAIQCPSKIRPCPPGSFEVSDYDVLPDGSHKAFNQCYCDDATREEAAVRFIKTLYQKRPALLAAAEDWPDDALAQLLALTGTDKVKDPAPLYDGKGTKVSLSDPYYLHIAWFSHVMRDSKYFGLELEKHIGASIRNHNAIAAETGSRIDGGPANAPPKEEDPDLHYSREEWLSLLGSSLLEDAKTSRRYALLPPRTFLVLTRFQKVNGLVQDGIPGPKTLEKLLK